MAKPILAAHLCPTKLYWELGHLPTHPDLPSQWWQQPEPLIESLHILAIHGISSIRLTIFNTELTTDGQTIDWTPLDLVLEIARRLHLQIDLCLGPYQYPFYPGIRLPKPLQTDLKNFKLDHKKNVNEFGRWLLTEQLKRYGKNRTIRAFYLGNEWHTSQRIEDGDNRKYRISLRHMQSLARICKRLTKKPIILNTNHDAIFCKKIQHDFLPLFQILKQQAWLALDIYPSRISLGRTPRIWMNRQRHGFATAVKKLKQDFSSQIMIGEFEAQPWGDGRAWALQLSKVIEPRAFTSDRFQQTIKEYQLTELFPVITFWSAEFLLVAKLLNHPQYLMTIKKFN